MEEHKKKLPRKSVIIFSAIFVSLIILIAVFGRFLPQKPQPTQQSAPAPVSRSDLNKEYTSALFSFHYPSSWKRQLYNIKGGGNGVTIQPVSTKTEHFPLFHVEVAPISAEESKEKRIGMLRWLNLQRSETTVLSNPATKLSGILPPLLADGKPINKRIRKTYIFFESAGYLYIVTYAYFEDDKTEEKEQFFQNILDTVTLPEGAL